MRRMPSRVCGDSFSILAVRGKLVEQDPKDEPASELLKRIHADKMRLVRAGTIKLSGAKEAGVDVRYAVPDTRRVGITTLGAWQ